MSDYNSSEELQRHKADVFAREEVKKVDTSVTEKDRLKAILDRYLKKHQTTKGVQEELGKHKNRSLELQFGISHGIVDILEKIKSELR